MWSKLWQLVTICFACLAGAALFYNHVWRGHYPGKIGGAPCFGRAYGGNCAGEIVYGKILSLGKLAIACFELFGGYVIAVFNRNRAGRLRLF